VAQGFTIELSATKDFKWDQATVATQCVIIQPHSTVHGKGPKANIVFIRPVNGEMDHHGPCHVLDSLNGTFSRTILVMSTNTRDSLALISSKQGIAKLRLSENSIVSVRVVNRPTTVHGLPFKLIFGSKGVSGTKGNLVPKINEL